MKHLTSKDAQILLAIYQIKTDAHLIPFRAQVKKYTGKYYSVGTIHALLNRLHQDGYLKSYIKSQILEMLVKQ